METKKLKLLKENDIAVRRELGVYCDYCGQGEVVVFTSSFDDRQDNDPRKCEMQICTTCITQLYKFV